MSEEFLLECVILKETGESGYVLDKRMCNGRKQLLVKYKCLIQNEEVEDWFDEKVVRVYKELVRAA